MTVVTKDVSVDSYKYGFHDSEDNYAYKSAKGLNKEIVQQISVKMKNEPQLMTDLRMEALEIFQSKPMPTWGNSKMLSEIDFDNIHYYVRSTEKQGRNWEDVPEEIKNTFDRLGIPEAERKFLAGVTAQYESDVVYHSIRED